MDMWGIPLVVFSIVYGLILIASGVFVLFVSRVSIDRVSHLILSAGLILSGFSVAILMPGPILYVAILASPYVYATIICILVFLSSDGKSCVETLLSVLGVSILLLFFVHGGLSLAIYSLSVLSIILLLRLRYKYRLLSVIMAILFVFGIIFLSIYESLVLLYALEILLIFEASTVLLVLYKDRIIGEYELSTEETKRKLTHLLAFTVLIPLMWAGTLAETLDEALAMMGSGVDVVVTQDNIVKYVVIILGVNTIPLFLIVEYLRITKKSLLIPPSLLRKNEKSGIAAYIYTLTGVLIVSLFCSQKILIASVITSLTTDAMAALVGVNYGKHKITKNRTLEGTIAGFITAVIAIFMIFWDIIVAVIVAIAIAIFDILNTKEINDNLIYQVLVASTLVVLGLG